MPPSVVSCESVVCVLGAYVCVGVVVASSAAHHIQWRVCGSGQKVLGSRRVQCKEGVAGRRWQSTARR